MLKVIISIYLLPSSPCLEIPWLGACCIQNLRSNPADQWPAYFPPFSLFCLFGLLSLFIKVHFFFKKVKIRFDFSTSKCTQTLI